MKRVNLVAILSFALITGQSIAGGSDHKHSAGPNGGIISEFGDLHAEGVKKEKSVGFYVLDATATKADSVKKHSGGLLIVVPKKAKIKKTTIEPGKNFNKIMVPTTSPVKMIKMKLKVGSKGWSAKAKF